MCVEIKADNFLKMIFDVSFSCGIVDNPDPERSLPTSHKPHSNVTNQVTSTGAPSSNERNLQDHEYHSPTGKIVTSQGAVTSTTVTQSHTGTGRRNNSVEQVNQCSESLNVT